MTGVRWLLDSTVVRILLGVNCLIFLGAIYLLFSAPSTSPEALAPPEVNAIAFQAVKRPELKLSLTAFTDKPLVHASRMRREVQRQEVRQGTVSAIPVTPPSKSYRLTGIIAGAGGEQMAYVTKTVSGETVRLKVGDIVEDWKVTAIGRDQVTFTRENATDALSLQR